MAESDICILLNGWGGFGGTGIIDCLRDNPEGRKIRIVSTGIFHVPAMEFKSDRFHILPRGDSPEYIAHLLDLCKREKIDVVLPGSSPEIMAISQNMKRIESEGMCVALDSYENIGSFFDKSKAYDMLKEKGVVVPEFVRVERAQELLPALERLGYPDKVVCFKPFTYYKSGNARGFRVLRQSNTLFSTMLGEFANEIDYDSVRRLAESHQRLDVLAMEYLPGPEFSVYVLSERGKMLYCVPNLRKKTVGSYTFEASTVKDARIWDICEKIVKAFGLSYNTNIQMRESEDGILKIVEINPRMGGSIVLPKAAGINMPYLSIKQALGESIPYDKKHAEITMARYIKETFGDSEHRFEIAGPQLSQTDF